jgi:hypothetical protein
LTPSLIKNLGAPPQTPLLFLKEKKQKNWQRAKAKNQVKDQNQKNQGKVSGGLLVERRRL